MTLDKSLNTVRDGLERLRTAKRRPKIFGADEHGFELHPPLTESAVKKFESRYEVRLPVDYRRFLIELGNGGAGPFYGQPFPHTAPWNDLTGNPEPIDDEDEFEKAYEEFEGRYWSAANVNGAVPICHEGCAYRDWLVLTGPEAGHMWHDARADHRGLYPISIGKKKRGTFLDWYLDWLNEAVAKLPKSRRPT